MRTDQEVIRLLLDRLRKYATSSPGSVETFNPEIRLQNYGDDKIIDLAEEHLRIKPNSADLNIAVRDLLDAFDAFKLAIDSLRDNLNEKA